MTIAAREGKKRRYFRQRAVKQSISDVYASLAAKRDDEGRSSMSMSDSVFSDIICGVGGRNHGSRNAADGFQQIVAGVRQNIARKYLALDYWDSCADRDGLL